ncbi:DUF4924 family protein [Cyclobacterium jeungdonense]|uniref:DUF4924 family protein n=1 Tax=Cyclobacterium jeungdonense TaxID=708087 RepID=A0ABT8C818_9BACT|nr:DUF4924 family protein [Cyclobacterium jeungdonense]MDN3688212.1 DUF4924 family protein [Cyclobacterium jeungdonense]
MKSIAEKKKKEHLVEYILYLYRMEDLIRAYQFNMEDLEQYVLAHKNVSQHDRVESKAWLADLAESMKHAGVEEKGHLPEVQALVDRLAKFHWKLLKTDPDYLALHRKAQPHLLTLLSDLNDENPGHEIQIFIHTLYGLLLSKLNGKKAPESIEDAAARFGEVLSYLDARFRTSKPG